MIKVSSAKPASLTEVTGAAGDGQANSCRLKFPNMPTKGFGFGRVSNERQTAFSRLRLRCRECTSPSRSRPTSANTRRRRKPRKLERGRGLGFQHLSRRRRKRAAAAGRSVAEVEGGLCSIQASLFVQWNFAFR